MTNIEIKKAVAGQIIAMLSNNILEECGYEPFIGWLEDGDAFYYAGMSEEDIEKAMALVKKIEDNIENISVALAVDEDLA